MGSPCRKFRGRTRHIEGAQPPLRSEKPLFRASIVTLANSQAAVTEAKPKDAVSLSLSPSLSLIVHDQCNSEEERGIGLSTF